MTKSYKNLNWIRVSWAVAWTILCALVLFIIWYVVFIYFPAWQRQQETQRLLQIEIEILKKHGLDALPVDSQSP